MCKAMISAVFREDDGLWGGDSQVREREAGRCHSGL